MYLIVLETINQGTREHRCRYGHQITYMALPCAASDMHIPNLIKNLAPPPPSHTNPDYAPGLM